MPKVIGALEINEFSARFQAYMSRIENGRVNEPVTILETDQFPTHFFCSATRGWSLEEGAGQALFDDCNTMGYQLGSAVHCQDCVHLLESSYRYQQV